VVWERIWLSIGVGWNLSGRRPGIPGLTTMEIILIRYGLSKGMVRLDARHPTIPVKYIGEACHRGHVFAPRLS